MINDMISIGEWNKDVKDFIISDNGSIQKLNIKKNLKNYTRLCGRLNKYGF